GSRLRLLLTPASVSSESQTEFFPVTFRWGVPPPSRAQPMPLWTRSWRVQPACHGMLDTEEVGAEAPGGACGPALHLSLCSLFLPGPPPKRKGLTLPHQ
uniref:Uncharacterized protein n=1 Tax=Mandrillus leucophaeus TaxID=9568 RepID=A0A2K5XLY4_MANLE